MDVKKKFHNKKITVMGLGLLGRGVGDAKWLAQQGAELVVTDLKTEEELEVSVAQLRAFPNIHFVLGEHRLEDFANKDLILKAAGVPDNSPFLQEARKNTIPVAMSAALLVQESGAMCIGVTGTRGKSTVTHLLHAILKHADKHALLGGNIRGIANLPLFDEVQKDTLLVLELDSWQLQGFGEAQISPHVSIFTTFFPDHLNYYKNDTDAYLADKANIFLCQEASDTLIVGEQAAPLLQEKYKRAIRSKVSIAGEKNIPKRWQLQIPGEHNRYNAALAIAAARELGVGEKTIQEAVERFKGVPGRLEHIAEKSGVIFYNDTTATTPEATLAALHALGSEAKNIVLLMGGADKGLDMTHLVKEIPNYCKEVVLLPGTGSEKIRSALTVSFQDAATMQEGVLAAQAASQEGDVILLSPAFASFGLFNNEFDRGDQFVEAVEEI